MVIKYLSALLFLLFPALHLYSQPIQADKEIDNYFTSILKNESYNLSSNTIKAADASKIIRLAHKNISNTDAHIRYKIIDLVKRKSGSTIEPDIRINYIEFLTESIKDSDGGNSGIASKSLTSFNYNDFNQTIKDTIYTLLTRNTYHYDQLVKLAGFLKIDKARIFLKNKVSTDSTLTQKNKWNYCLALARMGDNESIDYCMNKTKSMPVNNNTVNFLFPDLVYTRQPQLVKYVLDQLLSDVKNCNSPNPDSEENISCAYKIMEMVAPVVKDFPVKVDKYGDLDIDNYNETLTQVRNWIKANPEPVFLNEKY